MSDDDWQRRRCGRSPRTPTADRADRARGRGGSCSPTLFGAVAVASWFGGEVFLAAMGAIGCLMTLWVGVLTLVRG